MYLGARLLATLQPNGSGGEFTQYHHPDRLGTRLITNASDTTYQEQVSLPYGIALNAESTGSTNRRFTSYDRSTSTGLDYAVNRHYDSQQGRFTQVDPIGMSASSLENPQSMNLYAYCGNDPINHLDPSGLFWGKLWHGIKKILSNKWVRIAIAVAMAILIYFAPPLIIVNYSFTTAGITSSLSLTAAGWAVTGLSGALSVGMALQSQQEGKPKDAADVEGCGGSEDNPCVYKIPGGSARRSVGQPGFWEGLIPVWGPGRMAIDDFQNGRIGWGILHTLEAISDFFLVKALWKAGAKLIGRGGTEVVERAMSRAELESTEATGLLRGGREGTHYASDAVNSNALRARQRLALPQTPEVRVTLEVPAGTFSRPMRVDPAFGMRGGGLQRTARGKIRARVVRSRPYH